MTGDEIITDLRDRIDRAVTMLEEAEQTAGERETIRLVAKANGLLVVKDWLRGYQQGGDG